MDFTDIIKFFNGKIDLFYVDFFKNLLCETIHKPEFVSMCFCWEKRSYQWCFAQFGTIRTI